MKNYPHILSYLALSLLAACGGGGGGGSPSTASSDTNQPKIECNAECQAGRKAAEEAKAETERKAAEEAEKAKAEAERKTAEKAKAEAERKAAEEAEKAKAEAERKAAEEAEKAKAEAERKATEEAQKAKVEAERKSAEEAEKAKAEAERKAAEEAEKARVETERKAAEEAEKAKAQAERKAAEEAEKARVEAERKAAEEAEKAKAEAERKAAEEAEKTKVEAERKAAEKAKAEAERKAAEAAAATQQIDGYYSKISQSGMEGDDISHIGDINILEVDGQKISLLPETEPQRAEVFGNVNEKSVLVAATHLKYGRYGFYGLKNGDTDIHTSYMFYQGVITPEAAMPQEGQAFYRGYALYSDVGQANTFGNSIFMVDFSRKSLSGAVYSENGEFDEVNLEGQIVGNRFFHVDEKEQKIMSGMFLGPQAEELTGRFDHLLESKNGTFGAAALKE